MGRKELEEICDRYLSRREEREKAVDAVERCVKKGYDYERLKDKLLGLVTDSHKAHKIIDKVTSLYPQLRKRTKFEENREGPSGEKRRRDDREDRENRRGSDRDRDRERDRDRSRVEREKEEQQRKRDKIGYGDPFAGRNISDRDKERLIKMAQAELDQKKKHREENKNFTVTEDDLRAKELMLVAQQEIEERKKQFTSLVTGTVPDDNEPVSRNPSTVQLGILRPQEAALFVNYSMDKKSRIEELKAKLNASRTLSSIAPVVPKKDTATAEEKKQTRKQLQEAQFEVKEYMDPRIIGRAPGRKARVFNFHEKGEFERLANKQRAMAKLDLLQAEISEKANTTGISSAVKLAMVTPATHATTIPDIEWWDQIVLEKDNYDEIPEETVPTRYSETVTNLVEHPTQLRPATEPHSAQFLRTYLTKKETKKIRRQNRKEMQKEKTEKIRLGLEKPPEPKVKLSNLMRVLGNDAVQDPTKMEAHVRKQMAERMKKHETENASRKLTDAQKAAKKAKKLSEDTTVAVHVAVYRIKSLANPSKKFKVETNAKQLQMTGIVLLYKDINVVVVEGGPKQQKFYKNLLMTRMKWGEEVIGDEKKKADQDAPGERNECKLVWEGTVKKRAFHDMKAVSVQIQKQARETFERQRVPHYWDLCLSSQVLLDAAEEQA